jgi:murein DD-endopeptidase MepM/ murein hydrolase activator NlpD
MKLNVSRHLVAAVLMVGAIVFGVLTRVSAQQSIVINKEFQAIEQGSIGVIRVSGPDIASVEARVFDRTYPFFVTTQGFASLISVDLRQRIREYPLTIILTMTNGTAVTWEDKIKVNSGGFIAEPSFALPADRMYLLNPDIQTNEDFRLRTIYSGVTTERFWDGPVSVPMSGRFGSPFGSVRTYTDGQTRRHTGVDISAATGTLVLASSNGRVVFARPLDIHGNHVVIDHGWGIFSAYSHLSTLYVVPGQFVLQGDVIGLSGNTGRSTGPHLHWEIAVNGIWVDPVRFQQVKLPY